MLGPQGGEERRYLCECACVCVCTCCVVGGGSGLEITACNNPKARKFCVNWVSTPKGDIQSRLELSKKKKTLKISICLAYYFKVLQVKMEHNYHYNLGKHIVRGFKPFSEQDNADSSMYLFRTSILSKLVCACSRKRGLRNNKNAVDKK